MKTHYILFGIAIIFLIISFSLYIYYRNINKKLLKKRRKYGIISLIFFIFSLISAIIGFVLYYIYVSKQEKQVLASATSKQPVLSTPEQLVSTTPKTTTPKTTTPKTTTPKSTTPKSTTPKSTTPKSATTKQQESVKPEHIPILESLESSQSESPIRSLDPELVSIEDILPKNDKHKHIIEAYNKLPSETKKYLERFDFNFNNPANSNFEKPTEEGYDWFDNPISFYEYLYNLIVKLTIDYNNLTTNDTEIKKTLRKGIEFLTELNNYKEINNL